MQADAMNFEQKYMWDELNTNLIDTIIYLTLNAVL